MRPNAKDKSAGAPSAFRVSLSPMSSPSEAWASTKSWGNDTDKPMTIRDKYGRKVTVPPKAQQETSSKTSSTGMPRGIEHVKVAGHNNLLKKVIKVGDGARGTPSAGARVTIHAVGHLPMTKDGGHVTTGQDGVKFYSTRERIIAENAHLTTKEANSTVAPGPQTFTLGAGSVVPCWDLAVPTMLVGETCELIVAPEHAYGDEGSEHLGVPPKVPLVYILELLDWKRAMPPRETMPDAERFSMSTELKFRGTARFKVGAWDEARELYDDAAHYLSDAFLGGEALKSVQSLEHPNATPNPSAQESSDEPRPPPKRFGEQHDEARTMLLACLLNGAQCALKSEAWRAAEKRAGEALAIDPKNLKGLFRRGTARTRLGDYGDARDDLRRACELDPKSREIRDMYDECKISEAAEKDALQKLYANTGSAAVNGAYGEPTVEKTDPLFVC